MVKGRAVEREKRKGAGGQGVFWIEAAVKGGDWGVGGSEGMEREVDRAGRIGRNWRICMVGVSADQMVYWEMMRGHAVFGGELVERSIE